MRLPRSSYLLASFVLGSVVVTTARAQEPLIDSLGGGTPGIAGIPLIELDGAPITGRPLRIGIENARPGSLAVLGASATAAPVLDPATSATFQPLPPYFAFGFFPIDSQGRGGALIDVPPLSPALAGVQFFVQGAAFDPSAQGSVAVTDALEFRIGQPSPAALDVSKLFPGGLPVTGGIGVGFADVIIDDFDVDGNQDALALSANGVTLLVGDGQGGLQFDSEVATGSLPAGFAAADLNGDGAPDFVQASATDQELTIGIAGPGGSFTTSVVALGSQPIDLAIEDFDGDGNLDLAVLRANGAVRTTLSVLRGNGAGNFGPALDRLVAGLATHIAVADFDADGRGDVVASIPTAGQVVVALGTATGALGSTRAFAAGPDPSILKVGDVDGDGDLDVACLRLSGGGVGVVTVLENSGTAVLTGAQAVSSAGGASDFALSDANGDGVLDIVLYVNFANSDLGLETYIGLGTGSFAGPMFSRHGVFPGAFDVGDLNGDGTLDAVLTSSVASGFFVMSGTGNGSFESLLGAQTATLATPQELALGDVDRDGILDLLVVHSDGVNETLEVQRGAGDGTFQPLATTLLGVASSSNLARIECADMNGDGLLDLVTGNGAIAVWLGNGAGGFTQFSSVALTPPGGGIVRNQVVVELNGDGVLDVAAVGPGGGLWVLLGNGDGTLQMPTNYASGASPYDLAAGDLDGDGDVDLVAVKWITSVSNLVVFSNTGNGTFVDSGTYFAGKYPKAVRLGDLDGDGDLDVVVGNSPGGFANNGPSVLLGAGDGTFGPPTTYASSLDADEVRVADLNGDTVPDVVVLGYASEVNVYIGVGDGTLEAPASFTVGSWMLGVVIGDLDGDRLPDITVARLYGLGVRTLLNQLVE